MNEIYDVIERPQKLENRMDHWTPSEKETCKSRYGCDILIENGSYADVSTKEAPNDARIIEYLVEDKTCYDLTRGTKTRLFDMYWDKFRSNLKSINFGYGRINPKLWGYSSKNSKSKKRK
jgi:hypothetical protein